jgi:hypothetical protein
MKIIKFDQKTHFDACGRTGFVQCHGIELFNMGTGNFAEIHIHPINTRDEVTESCRMRWTPIVRQPEPLLKV